MMQINIHTHQTSANTISICNVLIGKEPLPEWDLNKFYSIGFHPWYIDEFEEWKETAKKIIQLPVIKAIGECGLDKNANFSLEQQAEVFCWHINQAEKVKKPLIIHCVRAFNELLKLKKDVRSSVPWIIHGYNANEQILQQCIQNELYISIGHHIFNPKSNIYKLAGIVPKNLLFLETDESILSIEEIYSQYSSITDVPIKELYSIIDANFKRCFKNW